MYFYVFICDLERNNHKDDLKYLWNFRKDLD